MRRLPVRLAALVLVLVFSSLASGLAAARQATPATDPAPAAPPLEPIPCAERYVLPDGLIDGSNVACSWLTVPARHAEPTGPTYRVFVLRLLGTGQGPQREVPLVWLNGGPGSAIGSMVAQFLPSGDPDQPGLSSLLAGGDVYLIDQRGVGASEPLVACPFDVVPNRTQAAAMAPATPVSPQATPAGPITIALPTEADTVSTVVTCVQGLRAAGLDLESFTTEEGAADVADLIRAIGGRADLYGVSYGTYIGQTVMDRTPKLVRSAVLASVSQPGPGRFRDIGASFDAILDDLFTRCAATPACAAATPDLEASLTTAYDRLSGAPVAVPLAAGADGAPAVQLTVDGNAFMQLLQQLATISLPATIPALIGSLAAGDDTLLLQLGPLLLALPPVQTGVQVVELCQEGTLGLTAAGYDEWAAGAGLRPEVLAGNTGMYRAIFAACEQLGLPVAAGAADARHSDVPALFIVGTTDPLTPPSLATGVAETFPYARVLTLDGLGHDPLSNPRGLCAVDLVARFLAAPTAPLDVACAGDYRIDLSATPAA